LLVAVLRFLVLRLSVLRFEAFCVAIVIGPEEARG
jgi:hypothetical protein